MTSFTRPWLIAIVLVLASASARAWHRLPVGSAAWPQSGAQAIRGVTLGPVECPADPRPCGYGSIEGAHTLDYLKARGVNWVALTPFGRVWNLKSTRIKYDFEASFEDNRAGVIRMTQMAHERGMRVMIIPHIFVESSGSQGDEAGGWRGEMGYGSEQAWQAYLKSYTKFILTWAEIAQRAGADAFSLGAECKSFSSRFYAFWQALISQTRERFDGLLTYSANWYDEVFDVIFWDKLDLIGVNAFYELAPEGNADYATYLKNAAAYREQLRVLSDTMQMPIVFMELGYASRRDSGVKPWKWVENVDKPVFSEDEQTRSYAAAAETFTEEAWFSGFFLWRYPSNIDDIQEPVWGFSPFTLEAERLLAGWFALEWAADAKPGNRFFVKAR